MATENRATENRDDTEHRALTGSAAVAADVRAWQADLLAGRRTGPLPRSESGFRMSWDSARTFFGADVLGDPAACPARHH